MFFLFYHKKREFSTSYTKGIKTTYPQVVDYFPQCVQDLSTTCGKKKKKQANQGSLKAYPVDKSVGCSIKNNSFI